MNRVRVMCQAIMDELPGAIDIAGFCTRLSALRERRILLLPFAATAETPSGLWVKGQHQDYIFYDETSSPVHQEAIIWHEVSHLILDHPGPRMDPEAARLLMPDLDPTVVLRMLGRGAYSQDIEREAEELVSHLMLDLAHRKRRSARPPIAGDTPLERLKAALNYQEPTADMANYMQDRFNVAAILVLGGVLVGRIRALVRNPCSAIARVTLLLWATAIAVTIVGNINVYAATDSASGIPHLAHLIMDCLGLTAAWAIQMWVLHWTYPPDVANVRIRRPLFLGAVTLLCVCFVAAPIDREAPLFLEAYAHSPWMHPCYVIFLVAFGYTQAKLGYMSLRYARLVDEPILRIGLRLIAAGSAFGLLFVINKALFAPGDLVGITPGWSNQAANRIVQAGMFYCILIGATCSTWAPRCVHWIGLYRRYQRVYPLWHDLHRAFPRTTLDPQPPPLTLALRPRAFGSARLRYRITRLVIEINDGRLQLRPYLSQATIDAAQTRAAATGLTGPDFVATVDATLIAVTLAEHWAGRPAAEEHPGLASPGHADLDAEIDYVTLVATAYQRVSSPDTETPPAMNALLGLTRFDGHPRSVGTGGPGRMSHHGEHGQQEASASSGVRAGVQSGYR